MRRQAKLQGDGRGILRQFALKEIGKRPLRRPGMGAGETSLDVRADSLFQFRLQPPSLVIEKILSQFPAVHSYRYLA